MTVNDWLIIAFALIGYLLGAVPFGVVVSQCLGMVDPRSAGSRNIGFTNVLRVSGKKAGFLTLAGDLGKGWLVGWLALSLLTGPAVFLVAVMPIIGHLYSVFLNFRGGKGVATALGVLLGVAPWIGVAVLLVWLLTAAVWRYSSAAAITGFMVLPVLAMSRPNPQFRLFAVIVSLLILSRHVENMKRLWAGTEPRIGQRREAN